MYTFPSPQPPHRNNYITVYRHSITGSWWWCWNVSLPANHRAWNSLGSLISYSDKSNLCPSSQSWCWCCYTTAPKPVTMVIIVLFNSVSIRYLSNNPTGMEAGGPSRRQIHLQWFISAKGGELLSTRVLFFPSAPTPPPSRLIIYGGLIFRLFYCWIGSVETYNRRLWARIHLGRETKKRIDYSMQQSTIQKRGGKEGWVYRKKKSRLIWNSIWQSSEASVANDC